MWAWIMSIIFEENTMPVYSWYEVGAGMGQNLLAIHDLYGDYDSDLKLYAVEPNAKAAKALKNLDIPRLRVYNRTWQETVITEPVADVVFTSGCLIHQAQADLKEFVQKISAASKDYIVCAEYYSPARREITYRGKKAALWTDDYGSHFLDNCPVRLIDCRFFYKRQCGLDDLTVFVFRKTN
jgi:hypothetical protein